ncbi:type III-B CRISPR module RAMP protein Cmr1 [Paraneptunicella aestuarii]|uniref:type III-B CRISPR module RAMP protein Cmr1 n=1 Tax=Paraneptunicella aestuarii TaxID=2831148 RepID=UPI001E3034CC|nr:type III-B CRISPR module RAMP protein Cmr1 [Paraneptunicella aestuarii]UAA40364.1 type III-B CRISPR module RAMP protein Cmr1 [Paraneptunicella aestuarii]
MTVASDFGTRMDALSNISASRRLYCATFEINTWLFMQGASKKLALREASIKGVLRYWWRALYWLEEREKAAREHQNYQDINNLALQTLHKRELDLWGGTEGASRVRLKVVQNKEYANQSSNSVPSSIGYGLGQGIYNKEILRPYYTGGTFSLKIELDKSLDEVSVQSVLNAVLCLHQFGCLGARSRNGFGSVTLSKLTHNDRDVLQFHDTALSKHLDKVLKGNDSSEFYSDADINVDDLPPIPAFSRHTQIIEGKGHSHSSTGRDGQQVLADLLDVYKEVRKSYANDDKAFFDSYAKDGFKLENWDPKDKQNDFPQRFFLGMPMVWSVKREGDKPKNYRIEAKAFDTSENNNGKAINRRGSMFFMKVARCKNTNSYIHRVLFMPSLFLPLSPKKVTPFGKFKAAWKRKPEHNKKNRFGTMFSKDFAISSEQPYRANKAFFSNFKRQLSSCEENSVETADE